ncbi:hypothetical protein C2G38_2109154 [Gigaspora rosea]|uniref:Uncharacterized protein n=1 Tax=Gigaspora rosea TaxID=44941 RepID=A0A397UKA2_9GLOM|nr:hypothetical protein C2G38_2109154 [Gigaspora rosea]
MFKMIVVLICLIINCQILNYIIHLINLQYNYLLNFSNSLTFFQIFTLSTISSSISKSKYGWAAHFSATSFTPSIPALIAVPSKLLISVLS